MINERSNQDLALECIMQIKEFVDGAFFASIPLFQNGPHVVSSHVLEDLLERIALLESKVKDIIA